MKKRGLVFIFILSLISLSFFVSAIYDDSDGNGVNNGLDSFSEINGFDNFNNVEGVVNNQRMIRDRDGNMLSTNVGENGLVDNAGAEYFGYIVEFNEEPVLKKQTELKKELEKNLQRPTLVRGLVRVFGGVTSEGQLESKVARQEEKINSEHETVKQRIADKIGKEIPAKRIDNKGITGNAIAPAGDVNDNSDNINSGIVLGEYSDLFNGIALNVNDEEAKEIKKISGVKSVSPNYKVHTLMQDTLPLIGATDVWEQDINGGVCSGEDCITGKGVKIAIIDTGVDYTHEDLGASVSSNVNLDFLNKITSSNIPQGYNLELSGDKLYYSTQDNQFEIYSYNFKTGQNVKESINDSYSYDKFFIYNNVMFALVHKKSDGFAGFVEIDLDNKHENVLIPFSGNVRDFNAKRFEQFLFFHFANDISTSQPTYNNYVYDFESKSFSPLDFSDEGSGSSGVINNGKLYLTQGNDASIVRVYNLTSGQRLENFNTNQERTFFLDSFGDYMLFYQIDLGNYKLLNTQTDEISQIFQVPALSSTTGESIRTSGYAFVWSFMPWIVAMDDKIIILEEMTDWGGHLNRFYIYDRIKEEVVSFVNLPYAINEIHINENKVCFSTSAHEVYCFDYDSDKQYDIPSSLNFNSKVIGGYDFVNGDADPMDDQGHGTHVAGTAAGKGDYNNNGVYEPQLGEVWGVAPDAQILAYKALDSSGSGSWSGIMSAIEQAVNDGADIISMSLGGSGNPDDPISTAVDNAVDAGVSVVVSAGNSGPSLGTVGSPGTARKAITVGASYVKGYSNFFIECESGERIFDYCGSNYPFSLSNKPNKFCGSDGKAMCNYWGDNDPVTDRITSFSSRGPVVWTNESGDRKYIVKPDVVASGALICAARYDSIFSDNSHLYYKPCIDDKHVLLAGTSMATPVVSGSVALLKQKHSDWTPEEIKNVLKGTSVDGELSPIEQGNGRIQIDEAVSSGKYPIAKVEIGRNVNGIIDIAGTVDADNIKEWRLYYGGGLNPSSWRLILSGNSDINNGVLVPSFDTSVFDDGFGMVKLEVEDTDGKISKDSTFFNSKNINIFSPLNGDTFKLGEMIPVLGNITLSSLISYKIEYASGLYPQNAVWKEDKIVLSSASDFRKGILGYWDTSGLADSEFYTLRISIETDNGVSQRYVHKIYLDSRFKEGWPKEFPIRGQYVQYYHLSPNVADLDNDGKKEIITLDLSGSIEDKPAILTVYNADGTEKWKKELNPGFSWPNVAIDDVNGDGYKEIFFELDKVEWIIQGSLSNNPPYVYGFDYKGDTLPGWPVKGDKYYSNGGVILADLDNDGEKEIIANQRGQNSSGGYKDLFNIYDYLGNKINSIESEMSNVGQLDGIEVLPAVGNFDDDSDLEIVVKQGDDFNGNKIMIFNRDGSPVSGWPVIVSGTVFGSPVVADINNDSSEDIIVGSYGDEGGVYAFNRDGSPVSGWPSLIGRVSVTPAVADLDGDGYKEISVSTWSDIYVLNYTGGILSGWPASNPYAGLRIQNAIADINGDGNLDIVASVGGMQPALFQCGKIDSSGGLRAWNFDGTPIDLAPSYSDSNTLFGELTGFTTPVITDLDENGKIDIVYASEGNPLRCPLTSSQAPKVSCSEETKIIDNYCEVKSKNRHSLYVVELDTAYSVNNRGWSQFQHDAQHTGCYDCGDDVVNNKLYHPADSNEDGRINISEVTAYGGVNGQKNVNYSSASFIWKNGELYNDRVIGVIGDNDYVVFIPSELIGKAFICIDGQLKGDLDNNKLYDNYDLDLLNSYFAGVFEMSNPACMDINGNGEVSVADVTALSNLIAESGKKPLICGNYGDVNNDKFIGEDDKELIRKAVLKEIEFTKEQNESADVNNDGNVSTLDIAYITRYLNDEINTFPVCSVTNECVDSDGGKNYFVNGTTIGKNGAGSDVCNGNVLTEYYCLSDGNGEGEKYDCGVDKCIDGKCMKESKESKICTIMPKICPPHGKLKETCVNYFGEIVSEEEILCSVGICKGCLVRNDDSDKSKCIPYGTRIPVSDSGGLNKDSYCDVDGELKVQKSVDVKGNKVSCNDNYECESNSCSSGKCVDVSGSISETGRFRGFFVTSLCKITNMFDEKGYEECVKDYS